jgi:hypothetical protein
MWPACQEVRRGGILPTAPARAARRAPAVRVLEVANGCELRAFSAK